MAITDQPDDPIKGVNLDDLIYRARKARGVYTTPADEIAAQGEAQGFDVTSKNTGKHAVNSEHYNNNAVDFRTRNQTPEAINNYINNMISQGYKVLDERKRGLSANWSGPHLHIQGGGNQQQVSQQQQVDTAPEDPLDQIIAKSRADRARARGFNSFLDQGGIATQPVNPMDLAKPSPNQVNIQAPGQATKPAIKPTRSKVSQPVKPSLNAFLGQGGIESGPIPQALQPAMQPGSGKPSLYQDSPNKPEVPLDNQDYQTFVTKQTLGNMIPGMNFINAVAPNVTDNIARRVTSFRNQGVRAVGDTLLSIPEALPVMTAAGLDVAGSVTGNMSWKELRNTRDPNGKINPPSDSWGVRALTAPIKELIKAQFPVEDDSKANRVERFIMETLPQAAGSQAAFAAVSALTGGGPISASIMGLLVNGSQAYDDALQKGASPAQAIQAAQINGIFGLSEGLGFGKGLDRFTGKKSFIKHAGDLLEEPIQESSQQGVQNAVTKYSGIDPNQALGEGVLESGLAAGILSGGGMMAGRLHDRALNKANQPNQTLGPAVGWPKGTEAWAQNPPGNSPGRAPSGAPPSAPSGGGDRGPLVIQVPETGLNKKTKGQKDTTGQLPFDPQANPEQQNLPLPPAENVSPATAARNLIPLLAQPQPRQTPVTTEQPKLGPEFDKSQQGLDLQPPPAPPAPVIQPEPPPRPVTPGPQGAEAQVVSPEDALVNSLTSKLNQAGLVPNAPTETAPTAPAEPTGKVSQPTPAAKTPQTPGQKVVTYDGQAYTLTDPEKIKQWETQVEGPRSRRKDKGTGHRTAAAARQILNLPTATEAANDAKRKAGFYRDKPVSVEINGQRYNANVMQPAFGRIKVRLADGQEITVDKDLIGDPIENSPPPPVKPTPVDTGPTFESKGKNKNPVTGNLLNFVRQYGIRETDYNAGDMKSLTNRESGTSGIIKKNGLTADEVRAMAVSEGLSTATTVGEFVDELNGHLDRERSQKGVYNTTEADIDKEYEKYLTEQAQEDERQTLEGIHDAIERDGEFANAFDKVSHETDDPTQADLEEFRRLSERHNLSPSALENLLQEWADNRDENRRDQQSFTAASETAQASDTQTAAVQEENPLDAELPDGTGHEQRDVGSERSNELTPAQKKLNDAAKSGNKKAIEIALGTIGKRQLEDGSINPDLANALEGTDVEVRLVEAQSSAKKPVETKVQLVHKTTGEILSGPSQDSVDRAKATQAKRAATQPKEPVQAPQAAPTGTETQITTEPAQEASGPSETPTNNYPEIADRKVAGSEVYGKDVTPEQARAIDRRITQRLGTDKGPTTKFAEMAFKKHELLGEDENSAPPPFAAVDSVREALDLPVIPQDDPSYSDKVQHTLDALAEKFDVKRLSQLSESEYNKIADWVAGLGDDVAIEAFSRSQAAMILAHEGAREFFAHPDVKKFMKTVQDYINSHNGELPNKKALQAIGINANVQEHLKTLAQNLNIPIAKEAFKNFYEDWKLTGGRFDYGGQRWLAYQYANPAFSQQARVPRVLPSSNDVKSDKGNQAGSASPTSGTRGTGGTSTQSGTSSTKRSRRSAQSVQEEKGAVTNEIQKSEGRGRVSEGQDTSNGLDQRGVSSKSNVGSGSKRQLITARADLLPPVDTSVVDPEIAKHLVEHQLEGAARGIASLDKTGGFLNADGTGAGKTRQLLAIADHYAKQGEKVLIIAPNNVLGKPFEKRSKNTVTGSYANDAKAMGVNYTLNKGDQNLEAGKIHLTTYTAANLENLLQQVDKNTVLILDEAHEYKNSTKNSPRALAGLRAAQEAGKTLYASATPADKVNHLEYLVRAGSLEGKSASAQLRDLGMLWKDHPHHKGVILWYVDPRVGEAEVNRRLEGLFNRMTERGQMIKREIALDGMKVGLTTIPSTPELQAEMDKIADVYPGPRQRGTLLQQQRYHQEKFKVEHVVGEIKKALANGEQVVVFAALVNESHVRPSYKDSRGNVTYGPPVVTSQGTVKLLREALAREGITGVSEIHGEADTSSAKAMADFQSGKNQVVIATLGSGGTGINLDDIVGDKPRYMPIMTAPFSGVDAVQALGRIWRLTTMSNARAEFIFTDSNVDDWNKGIIARKMKTMKAVVAGEIKNLDFDKFDDAELEAQYNALLEEGKVETPKTKPASEKLYPEMTLSPDRSEVRLSFPKKPSELILSTLRAKGFKYNWDLSAWVAPNNGDNKTFASNLTSFARGNQEGATTIFNDLADLLVHPNPLPDAKMPSQQDLSGYVAELMTAIRENVKSGKLKVDPNNPFHLDPTTQKRWDDAIDQLVTSWQAQDHDNFIQARMELANILNNPKHKILGDAMRPLMLAMDGSFALMQGGWNAVTHPVYWLRSGLTSLGVATHGVATHGLGKDLFTGLGDPKSMLKTLTSTTNKSFNEFLAQVESHPHAAEWKAIGLTLDSRAMLELLAPRVDISEGYAASFVNKLPGFKQSELAMKVMLDVLKIQTYERMRDILVSKGLDPVVDINEFKKAARWALISSGRGDFGKYVKTAKALTRVGLAPRFVLSGFQQLYEPWKELINQGRSTLGQAKANLKSGQNLSQSLANIKWTDPVGKMVVADATKAYAATMSLAAFASLVLGWEIPTDPDDPKFLMAKIPGSNLAFPVVPSNLQPPIKFMSRLVKRVLQTEMLNPIARKLTGGRMSGHDNLSVTEAKLAKDVFHFARSKAGIIPGAVIERGLPYQRTANAPPATGQEDFSQIRPPNLVKSGIRKSMNYLSPGSFESMDKSISRFGGYGSDYLNKPVNWLDTITSRLAPIYANNILENLTNPQLSRKEAITKSTWEFFGGRSVGLRSTYSDSSKIPQAIRSEFQDKGVPIFGVRQEQGETDAQYTRRMTTVESMYEQYGASLINNNRYQSLPDNIKPKVLEAFRRRVADFNEGQANKVHPDYNKLRLDNILDSLDTGKDRQKHIRERRRRENISQKSE